MSRDLNYADYVHELDAGRSIGFRQRDLIVTQKYDEEYLASRYLAIDEKVRALSARRLAVLEAFFPWRGRLLDFGCGTGRFVEAAYAARWAAWGYDIAPAVKASSGRMTLGQALGVDWDVVTFFDSLEHLPDPAEAVRKLRARVVMISVPWCHHPCNPDWFMEWKHRREGEHLWAWGAESLDQFFATLGYSPVMHSCFEDEFRARYDPATPNILTAIYTREPPTPCPVERATPLG